ncbi:MAG TPA: four helix bundle protein [Gammaproteobacteria bacterium]|nr:four helix bundle protein [Gammaproteobacteria bacterium]
MSQEGGEGCRLKRPRHDLKAWQEAMELARKVYTLVRDFPAEERYGLTAQIRRSAISVPSNIAEGCARGSAREFLQFPYIARGSLSELETQLRLAHDFGFCDAREVLSKIEALFALFGGLIKSQRRHTDALQAAKPPTDRSRKRPTCLTQ